MSAIQAMPRRGTCGSENSKQWFKAILMSALAVGLLFLLATDVFASDGDEFKAAAAQFEEWVKGNLGKLAAFTALAVGSIVAAVRKDWSWFFGAVVLSIGVGILAGVVNSSFTATI